MYVSSSLVYYHHHHHTISYLRATGSNVKILHRLRVRRTVITLPHFRMCRCYTPHEPRLTRCSLSSSSEAKPVKSNMTSKKPLLLVKLTGYRLSSTTAIIAFATTKLVPSLNRSMLPSAWLPGWTGAVFFGGCVYFIYLEMISNEFDLILVRLLLLSSYEGVRPKRAGWFFNDDLTLDLLLWPIGFLFIGKSVIYYQLGSHLTCGQ
jgi:hypothetical protein